jgi:hypothetical protein
MFRGTDPEKAFSMLLDYIPEGHKMFVPPAAGLELLRSWLEW